MPSIRTVLSFGIALAFTAAFPIDRMRAAEPEYPQIIRMRYEAVDPKAGGNFTIWLDRETIRQGLDSRLYPAATYVEVTYITPAAGSPLLTLIEVQKLKASTPEFYHIGGTVRFRVDGMVLKSSNIPH